MRVGVIGHSGYDELPEILHGLLKLACAGEVTLGLKHARQFEARAAKFGRRADDASQLVDRFPRTA